MTLTLGAEFHLSAAGCKTPCPGKVAAIPVGKQVLFGCQKLAMVCPCRKEGQTASGVSCSIVVDWTGIFSKWRLSSAEGSAKIKGVRK